MTKTKPKKSELLAKLQRENMELRAQLAYVYANASRDIEKAGANLMASGVLVQMHALGGREIIPPVVIIDGLSAETIAAFRADLLRSYQRATEIKPKDAKQ